MGQDSARLHGLIKWFYKQYILEIQLDNPEGADKHAAGLFYTRYGCDRKAMPGQWVAFEKELSRLATVEMAVVRDAHLSAMGF